MQHGHSGFGKGTAIAMRVSLSEVVALYEEQLAQIPQALADFETAVRGLDRASGIKGTFGAQIWGRDGRPSPKQKALEDALRHSAWNHVRKGLNIDQIAPAAERARLDTILTDPPVFSLLQIREVFGEYLVNARFYQLKGLADCFCSLNPAYRSHSKVKVGVDGLPKRIIIERVKDSYGSKSVGFDHLRDALNALFVLLEEPTIGYVEITDWVSQAQIEKTAHRGFSLKVFGNGNAHLFFTPHRLAAVNQALAEFYGDILPDSPEAMREDRAGSKSREVSKDLAFYWTPDAVIDRLLGDIGWQPATDMSTLRFLEPSCGDGRILDRLKELWPEARTLGIEVHGPRAEAARSKGHTVHQGNFLDQPVDPTFDLVVMNPPFAGRHWMKHLEHALRFLAPGGQLIAVLPASASCDGHLAKIRRPEDVTVDRAYDGRDGFMNLPTASFAEAGTNVATGYVSYRRKAAR